MTDTISCILAIDPGLSGAVAFYFPAHPDRVSVYDMPVAGGALDCAGLAHLIRSAAPSVAIIEQVASRPGQGVSSTFKFGQAYGSAVGVVAACTIPVHLVTPSKWKKHFNLDSDKERARAMALRLWPSTSQHFARKKDHGRAEAALLARYAAEVLSDVGMI